MDCIEGLNGQELPWEGEGITTVIKRRLGIFKTPTINLLSRNPSERPSMSQFCESCYWVLAGSTSVQL
jgi:hypothetical protein